jgi:hypothetical protein
VFDGTEAPDCIIDNNRMVVRYNGADEHPSWKCTHNADMTACSCEMNHPTHHEGSCFELVHQGTSHFIGGTCTDAGLNFCTDADITCQNSGTPNGRVGDCGCTCPAMFGGDDCSVSAITTGTTCQDILSKNAEIGVTDLTSGLYTLEAGGPYNSQAGSAYCDMETDGGGWTLFTDLKDNLQRGCGDITSIQTSSNSISGASDAIGTSPDGVVLRMRISGGCQTTSADGWYSDFKTSTPKDSWQFRLYGSGVNQGTPGAGWSVTVDTEISTKGIATMGDSTERSGIVSNMYIGGHDIPSLGMHHGVNCQMSHNNDPNAHPDCPARKLTVCTEQIPASGGYGYAFRPTQCNHNNWNGGQPVLGAGRAMGCSPSVNDVWNRCSGMTTEANFQELQMFWRELPDVTCKTLLEATPSLASGTYSLTVDGNSFDAYCDMTTDGGGWTLFSSSQDPNMDCSQWTSAETTDAGVLNDGANHFGVSPAGSILRLRMEGGCKNSASGWHADYKTSAGMPSWKYRESVELSTTYDEPISMSGVSRQDGGGASDSDIVDSIRWYGGVHSMAGMNKAGATGHCQTGHNAARDSDPLCPARKIAVCGETLPQGGGFGYAIRPSQCAMSQWSPGTGSFPITEGGTQVGYAMGCQHGNGGTDDVWDRCGSYTTTAYFNTLQTFWREP